MYALILISVSPIITPNPLKQGLKLFVNGLPYFVPAYYYPKSTKTRIETTKDKIRSVLADQLLPQIH